HKAELARNVASRQGREDYVRVRLEPGEEGRPPRAVPVLGMSGLLRTLTEAHGVVRIPARREGLERGALVDVLLFS
ncbi:MAG: molybdopterin molybdenumtransferase MoeA, partial [Desulfovibrionaceae bacterium]|nr:molybdopterin molybdenumtransferase MoeA [Desulfovibrionaceae bacterium]